MLPHNVLRRELFWNLPPPIGVFQVPRNQLIDSDECAIFLSTANRAHGKAYVNVRVGETGVYGCDEKWTLIMAIDSNNFKHIRLRKVPGKFSIYALQMILCVYNCRDNCRVLFRLCCAHITAVAYGLP